MSADHVERRLAAIVATDVVGYSRLAGVDEEATLKQLRRLRADLIDPAVDTNRGRIVKSTGDGFLIEFASVVDAVRCSAAVQRSLSEHNADVDPDRRIVFRIGIHVGDVMVEHDGDLMGDGVNIAARIEGIAEPGGICLSSAAYEQVRDKLDEDFVELGERTLKNIARPVRIYQIDLARTTSAPAAATTAANPSIAVLPFNVLTADPSLHFVADGLAEDVIALLARMPGFFVISRASSFAFRDRATDVPRIAKELGVRYIVEGSLRGTSDEVRVTAQLTEAASGHVLWSGRFDSRAGDAFELQDEITRGIVAQLQPELTRAEISIIRRQLPDNVDAWGCYRQALGATSLEGWSEASVMKARDHLSRALEIAPDFALARAMFALLTALGKTTGVFEPPDDLRDEALRSAERAIDLDPGSSEVLGYAGCALADLGHVPRGIEILEQAIEIDPSNAQAHVALGAALATTGASTRDEGIAKLRHALRLSPHDRRLGFWGWVLSSCLLAAGRAQEALDEARTAARRDPKFHLARVAEAIVLLRLQRPAAAAAALAAARKLRPSLTIDELSRVQGRRAAHALRILWPAGDDPAGTGGDETSR
jgi:adenylate cyclase